MWAQYINISDDQNFGPFVSTTRSQLEEQKAIRDIYPTKISEGVSSNSYADT